MFAPLIEPIKTLSEAVKAHMPEVVANLRRYVDAHEKQADALAVIASKLQGQDVQIQIGKDAKQHGE